MSTDSKRKPGRPEGTVQTPHQLLRIDMKEQIRLNQRLRAILSKAADKLEKALEATDNPDLALKIVETLGAGLSNQSKAIDNTAKHVLPNEEERAGGDEKDLDKLLRGE